MGRDEDVVFDIRGWGWVGWWVSDWWGSEAVLAWRSRVSDSKPVSRDEMALLPISVKRQRWHGMRGEA